MIKLPNKLGSPEGVLNSEDTRNTTNLSGLQLSLFSSLRDNKPKSITLSEWFTQIKKGSHLVNEIRSTNNEERKKELKLNLPAVAINNRFQGGRTAGNVVAPLPLLEIEFDAKHNSLFNLKEWLDSIKPNLNSWGWCVAAYVTSSGKGIGFLVHINPEQRKDCFYSLEQEFKSIGLVVDSSSLKPTYLRAFTHDENVYTNFEATVYQPTLKAPEELKTPKKDSYKQGVINIDDAAIKYAIEQIEEKQVDITEGDTERWKALTYGWASEFGEAGREAIHFICSFYEGYKYHSIDSTYSSALRNNRGGATIGTFFQLCKNVGIDIVPPIEIKPYRQPDKVVDARGKKRSYFPIDYYSRAIELGACSFGKTYAEVNCNEISPYDHTFVVVPTRQLALQIGKEYDLHVIIGNSGDQQGTKPTTAKVQIGTYDAISKILAAGFDLSKCKLVVDEASELVAAGGYRHHKIKMLVNSFDRWGCVKLMTATWIDTINPAFDSFKIVKFETEPKPLKYHWCEYQKRLPAIADNITKTGKHIVFVNSKKEIQKILPYFKRLGHNCTTITREDENSEVVKYLADNQRLPDTHNVFFVTNYIALGFNLYNTDVETVHIVPLAGAKPNPYLCEQLVKRFREKLPKAIVYRSKASKKSRKVYGAISNERRLEGAISPHLDRANQLLEIGEHYDNVSNSVKFLSSMLGGKSRHIDFTTVDRKVKALPNYFNIAVDVQNQVAKNSFSNPDVFDARVKAYGWIKSDTVENEQELSKADQVQRKIDSQKVNKQESQEYERALAEVYEAGHEEAQKKADQDDNTIECAVATKMAYFKREGLSWEDSHKLCQDEGTNKRKHNTNKRRLRTLTTKPEDLTKEGRKVTQELHQRLQIGTSYSATELHQILTDLSTKLGQNEWERATEKQIVLAVQDYVHLKRCGKKKDYKVISYNPLHVNGVNIELEKKGDTYGGSSLLEIDYLLNNRITVTPGGPTS